MKKTLFMLFALVVFLTGCGKEQVAGGAVKPEPTGEPFAGESIDIGEESYLLGETVVYENVAIVPLISKNYDPQKEADYLTLAEAVKNDWVEIIEKPGSATVSELTVRYNGPKPLLLLAGELLLGGKQDRVVAKDTVIDPLSTVVVSVFCVEPGRWTTGRSSFGYSGRQVPSSVKEKVFMSDQSAVWESTGAYNADARVEANGVTTLDAGLNAKEVLDFTAGGRTGFRDVLKSDEAIVGLIFIIDGKIRSMEIFSAPRMLESSFDSIISGILADAAVSDGDGEEMPSKDDILVFMKDAFEAQANAGEQLGGFEGFVTFDEESLGVSGGVIMGSAGAESELTHGSYVNKKD